MRPTLKLRSPLVPLVTIILLIIQVLNPSKTWEALLVGFGGVWLTGWIWAHSIQQGLHLERGMRFGWAQVGDILEEQFTLSNTGRIPIPWVEIVDHSDLPGYRASLAVCLGGRESHTWRTRGVCSRRGIFTLGGATVRSSDPFGVYLVEIQHTERAALAVMPAVVPLPGIELAPGGWLGEGRPHPQAAEKVYSASTVRPYQHGDSLRLIHWRTTARLEQPFVRELEGAPEGNWWIVLDADSSVQTGSGETSTLEAGVTVAASLADRALRARKQVGLLVQGRHSTWIQPRGDQGQRLQVLRALAALEAGEMPLGQLLGRAAPALGRRASLVLITPSLDEEWLKPLGELAWRGIAPTVILVEPCSFGGSRSAEPMAALLAEKGITRHVIRREMLRRPEAQPERRGQWEWRIMPTGKAVPTRMPGDMGWKRLG